MKPTLKKHFQQMNPAMIIIYSYIIADLIGTLLLSLPASSTGKPVSVIDAFFVATSALCVTGLTVVDLGATFTGFAQWVIMALIEIGGLGVMTFSVLFFVFLGRGFSTHGRWIITESFTATPVKNMKSLLRSIFLFTFIVEASGAALLFFKWQGEMSAPSALFAGVFHSVSAFCNAGFSLFGTNLMAYRESILVNVVICSLIVLGGIGFPVIYEFLGRIRTMRSRQRRTLSLHTRTVLTTTAVLIASGGGLIFALERSHQLAGLSIKGQILASLFQSITARTAGFNTLDIGSLTIATLFILIILMFVGASPGSSGGGIKTTSLAVLVAILSDRIRGRHSASLFKRTIPDETVSKALSIFILAVIVLTVGLVFLLITQPDTPRESFLTYLFEAVSAFGTVGLSMGITPSLTVVGKLIIIVIMLLGRVGLLTVAYVVTSRRIVAPYRYSEEKIMIG
ncbi:MAG: TrkH family potassium uptake protein [Candidatus Krumholzibacteria bacterium]|nr:TrkH family potassium uptake protein [Candidatus Krumholzibacteria bacterium]